LHISWAGKAYPYKRILTYYFIKNMKKKLAAYRGTPPAYLKGVGEELQTERPGGGGARPDYTTYLAISSPNLFG
jgi:hypothetical protein